MSSPLIDDAICPEGRSTFCSQNNQCQDANQQECATPGTNENRFAYPECVKTAFNQTCSQFTDDTLLHICREGAKQGARPGNIFPKDSMDTIKASPIAYLNGYIASLERCTFSRSL